ncbi:MAG: hypothetical protein ISS70_08160 [Phycisphaerae bacterium]|nr:hypothetical protein [Phycisphaerae bacterium]
MKDKRQTRQEANLQIKKLFETGTEADREAIEQDRREGHGRRLRSELEEVEREEEAGQEGRSDGQ